MAPAVATALGRPPHRWAPWVVIREAIRFGSRTSPVIRISAACRPNTRRWERSSGFRSSVTALTWGTCTSRGNDQFHSGAEDERAANLLAGYVGVAIGNAQLYRAAVAAKRWRNLLATVSHDLKDPLNAIRLTTATLRRNAGQGKAGELAERIDRAGERMTRLIDDLLDAAKIEAGAFQAARRPEDVASSCDSAAGMFRLLAAEKSIQLAARAPSCPVAVLCERTLILRALANLIGNAVKVSSEGSSIEDDGRGPAGPGPLLSRGRWPGNSARSATHVFQTAIGGKRGPIERQRI